MALETDNNYQKRYGEAQTAYIQGDLELAEQIATEMEEDYPDDPSILLLKGHICLRQQEYGLAKQQYLNLLELTDDQELVEIANQCLKQIEEEEDNGSLDYREDQDELEDLENFALSDSEDFDFDPDELVEIEDDDEDWTSSIKFDSIDWDAADLEDEDLEDPTLQQNTPFDHNSFTNPKSKSPEKSKPSEINFEDVFNDEKEPLEQREELENVSRSSKDNKKQKKPENIEVNLRPEEYESYEEEFDPEQMQDTAAPTFVVSSSPDENGGSLNDLEEILSNSHDDILADFVQDFEDISSELEPVNSHQFDSQGQKSFLDEDTGALIGEEEDNLFFIPDEIDEIPDIDGETLPVSSIFSPKDKQKSQDEDLDNEFTGNFNLDSQFANIGIGEDELESGGAELPSELPLSIAVKPEVEIPQGKIGKFLDLSLRNKQIISSATVGVITFLAVLIVSIFNGQIKEKETEKTYSYPWSKRILLSLVAGVSGGVSTFGIGQVLTSHLKRYMADLQNQFEFIYQGNYNVKATIYSEDEFGQLASSFNQMAKMINTTTTEARRRAEDTERAREDLQRQVIRLLDDVEGAARGDLTVQAEVTADVLGAVADAFNLTITNLREIVKQVKKASIQVNKSSADSELYARNQSSDALRMAEELAVTLNSVQMMTDSIQRVAENAREAEEVARSSSVTALKGGDAVERTVAGILQIRETVAETARKVKRLAEASQQISTIVAVISQISGRTNLLALNASIQAARAGEAGRGFAIVAEEVRQLADRSAKSLQEIEQIVLQIQTETGSVMTAMEEGIQQVKDVTERSESAKRSLEDIIQVANRIDALVRSITADTVEQRENSRAVAKVMQAVELTAQATSQESQRVAASLQSLVGIARDLLSSVERFKVDPNE